MSFVSFLPVASPVKNPVPKTVLEFMSLLAGTKQTTTTKNMEPVRLKSSLEGKRTRLFSSLGSGGYAQRLLEKERPLSQKKTQHQRITSLACYRSENTGKRRIVQKVVSFTSGKDGSTRASGSQADLVPLICCNEGLDENIFACPICKTGIKNAVKNLCGHYVC